MEYLYTVVLVVKDGVFVSQFRAESVNDTFDLWMNDLIINNSPKFNDSEINDVKISYDKEIDTIVKINEMNNVWCADFNIKNHYLSVNIIRTVI